MFAAPRRGADARAMLTCVYMQRCAVILGIGHDVAVDWWALGVCLYEFLVGVPPFYEANLQDTFQNILERRLEWPSDMSPTARDLIDRLLVVDAGSRLGSHGAAEVKQHPFFADIDWVHLGQAPAACMPTEPQEPADGPALSRERSLSMVEGSVFGQSHADNTEGQNLSAAQLEMLANPDNFEQLMFTNESLLDTTNRQLAAARLSASQAAMLPTTSISAVGAAPMPAEGALLQAHTMRVLVAEDNPVTQRVAAALLKQMSIQVTQVYSGADAVTACERQEFDLIFMDVMMPLMDGIEATAFIRRMNNANAKVPIIAFTAIGESPDQFIDKGFADLLTKPFTKADLFSMVRKWRPP